jgi:ATP phosphoribosyltransferase-like protein
MLKIWISTQDKVLPWVTKVLQDAWYEFTKFPRSNLVTLKDEGVQFIWIKWFKQIRFLLDEWQLDGCIVGSDIIWEIESMLVKRKINTLLDLEFAKTRFTGLMFPNSAPFVKYILSKYPNLTKKWLQNKDVQKFLQEKNIQDLIVEEIESQADTLVWLWEVQDKMSCDIVETGDTARNMGLLILDDEKDIQKMGRVEALPSIPCSVQFFWCEGLDMQVQDTLEEMKLRLQMVVNGRKFVAIKYNVKRENLEKTLAVTPENKTPTINTTSDVEVVEVEILVPKKREAKIMVWLLKAGATEPFSYDPRLVM